MITRHAHSLASQKYGFTLLELSISIAIIALIAGMSASIAPALLENARAAQTEKKLDQIEKSIKAFREINQRLPCPSDVTIAQGSTNFGIEAAQKGVCTGGAPAIPASLIHNASQTAEGGIPVKALGLSDEFAYDGWGSAIAYSVFTKLTENDAFNQYSYQDLSCGRINVKDDAGDYRTKHASYLLRSAGPDMHGAYGKNGLRRSNGLTNADALKNCHCDSSGAATAFDNIYVQKTPTINSASSADTFDDIVRYKERWQMQDWENGQNPGRPCRDAIRFDGTAQNQAYGVIATGDINGDGIKDIIISVPQIFGGAPAKVYVIFGRQSWPNPTELVEEGAGKLLDGIHGFMLEDSSNTSFGWGIGVGDINKDGIDDIIAGAPWDNGMKGFISVIYGKKTGWAPVQTPDTAFLNGGGTALNGFRIEGESTSATIGYDITVSDINGDGFADIITTTPYSSFSGPQYGSVYVVYGKASGWATTQTMDATFLAGGGTAVNGFRLDNEKYYDGGYTSASGDVNGDGINDIIYGKVNSNPGSAPNPASIYVVYGKTGGWATTQTVDPAFLSTGGVAHNGFRLDSPVSDNDIGSSIGVGDINGDGIKDLLFTSHRLFSGALYAYVVYGKTSGWATTQTVNNTFLNGGGTAENGFSMDAFTQNGVFRIYIAAGDTNGDGKDDILIGTPQQSNNGRGGSGSAFVIYGKSSGWATTQTLDNTFLNGGGTAEYGFRLDGEEASDMLGYGIKAIDFNGDGLKDIFTTSSASPNGAFYAGSSYVIFGKKSKWAVNNDMRDLVGQ